MLKEAHTKAVGHHERAAKPHRTAAEHRGKGDHGAAHMYSTKERGHSETAHQTSCEAHSKPASSKGGPSKKQLWRLPCWFRAGADLGDGEERRPRI